MNDMKFEDTYTPHQAAEAMGVTLTRIYQLMHEKRLRPVVSFPRQKFFLKSDVHTLTDELTPRRPRSGNPTKAHAPDVGDACD